MNRISPDMVQPGRMTACSPVTPPRTGWKVFPSTGEVVEVEVVAQMTCFHDWPPTSGKDAEILLLGIRDQGVSTRWYPSDWFYWNEEIAHRVARRERAKRQEAAGG